MQHPAPSAPPGLDVLATLRLALAAYWRDFAPITFLGLLLVTLPSVVAHALFGRALDPGAGGDPALGTVLQTTLSVLVMLFVCAVSFGIMSALAGRPLSVRRFMASGLQAAKPGLIVSLILGTIAYTIINILLITRGSQVLGAVASVLAIAAIVWAMATLLPAIPAAIAERRGPMEAFARSLQLTRGNRGRLVGLWLVVGLALLPAAGLVNIVKFGPNPGPAEVAQAAAQATLLSPGLWIDELVNLLLMGAVASIPAAIYMQLIRPRRRP